MIPSYTSRGQFANMLEKRAKELDAIAERIRDAGGMQQAAQAAFRAATELRLAIPELRERR